MPDRRLPHGYKGLVGGSLGELEHQILLEQFSGKETADAIVFLVDGDSMAGTAKLPRSGEACGPATDNHHTCHRLLHSIKRRATTSRTGPMRQTAKMSRS